MNVMQYIHVIDLQGQHTVSISVSDILYMSVITQDGVSALMEAAVGGKTEVLVELVKAGANVDMQNKVRTYSDITTLIYIVLHVQKHTL